MHRIAIALVLLAAPPEPRNARPLGQKERAEIVDRLMAEPFVPRPRPAPAPDPALDPALDPAPAMAAPPDADSKIVINGPMRVNAMLLRPDRTLVLWRTPIVAALPPADVADDEPPDAGPIDPPPPRVRRTLSIAEENFDAWVFDGEVGDARRARLEAALAARLKRAAEYRRLTPAQVDKLRLAGRGDIKRFFDEVDGRRAGFDAARTDLARGVDYLNGLKPLTIEFKRGPFGGGSLFAKTLAKIEEDRKASAPARRED